MGTLSPITAHNLQGVVKWPNVLQPMVARLGNLRRPEGRLVSRRLAKPPTLASWVGACPGDESAGVSRSHRCPKGNRNMRRVLSQSADAAVKLKGSIFQLSYRRLLPRLGHNQAIGAVARKLCCLIWMILHKGIRYEERGPAVSETAGRVRITRMIRTLRRQGYRVEPLRA